MKQFTPRFDVLPAAQQRLWPELAAVPSHFVLYGGGTALALRLGHRPSVDFDFFSDRPLDVGELQRAAPFLRNATTLQQTPGTLTVAVRRRGSVKLSFFGSLTFGRVGSPELTRDKVLRVASLLDVAATKMKVLLQRVEAKDYLDIAALLGAGLELEQMLGAARTLFGETLNPLVVKKTLGYFEGGNLDSIDARARKLLSTAALADVHIPRMRRASRRLSG